MNANLKAALEIANIRVFQECYRSHPLDLAQEQLGHRTHYVDDSTIRFFGARVNETRFDHENGLWFALRESVAPPHSARVHRWAIFDLFGTCIGRTEERSNGTLADKLFPALRDSLDWEAHTVETLKDMAAKEVVKGQDILNLLPTN